MPIKTLIEFGLSEKEAKTYIALLELEVAKISEIARKTGINRSSTYVVLEGLKKQGLASESIGASGIKQYVAASPEVILQQTEHKIKKQAEVSEKIKKTLPGLRALYKNTKLRPKVYVYTGNEGIKPSYYDIFDEQILRGMKKFRVYEDMSNVRKFLPPDFIKDDVAAIKKTEAKMCVISPDNKEAKSVIGDYKKFGSNDEFLVIPENKFNKTGKPVLSFSIYEDKIDFTTQDAFVVVIESQEIADALKNIFDLAWEGSKKLSTTPK